MRYQQSLSLWCFILVLANQGALAFVCHEHRVTPLVVQSSVLAHATRQTARRNGMWSQDSDLEGSDRIKACIPYILPILDGDHFGKYIYDRVPPLGAIHDVLLGGLVNLHDTFPFSGVVLFIALTLGTRGNTEMNRNVRFSAQQAALIDVSLILPELISSAFEGEDLPRGLLEPCSTFVWYGLMTMVIYCIYCNLRGKKPDEIPYISGWSEFMVGPF